ncbi:MAG: hypothetical protein QOD72_1731 [Acidimicrobiaceae bacterium]|jgi:hypothetical protein|nr:hypothetical protein [Acidimicrobiaceae bacterium]
MGQLVGVVEKPSSKPGLVRFVADRNLTGSGHERLHDGEAIVGNTPVAELARRLFATGRLDSVHMFMNVVTVDLKKGFDSDGLADIIKSLYTYYRPGVVPPTDEELMAALAPEPSAAGGPSAAPAADGAPAIDSRVPAHLVERSRLALERWRAKAG